MNSLVELSRKVKKKKNDSHFLYKASIIGKRATYYTIYIYREREREREWLKNEYGEMGVAYSSSSI